jgi:tRNA(adenine34) deaminase
MPTETPIATPTDDERWMHRAIEVANGCLDHGDVPIGCVIVRDGVEIAAGGNERELREDPTAHAEILALQRAAAATGHWRLEGCTLYVTLEPCAMCAGAIVLARVPRVVFGAPDPKAGFAGSLGNLLRDDRLNHRVELTGGVVGEECGEVLRAFFRERRSRE